MWVLVLDCIVNGDPVPKGRPRAFRAGKMIRMYTPDKVKKYEQKVGGAVWVELKSAKRPVIPFGPVRVVANFYHKRPQRLMRLKDPSGRMMLCKKPDVDNCSKSLLDGISYAPLWHDDAQVCSLDASQWYTSKVGEPRVEFQVYRWEDDREDV